MKRARYWLMATLWALVIFALSAIPFEPSSGEIGFYQRYHLDKPVHLALFGALSWLVLRAAHRGHGMRLPAAVALTILLTSAYGAGDEWHQSFVANRYASVYDWIADTIGAIIGAGVYYYHESRASPKENR